MVNQKKEYEQLLVAHALWRATRKGVTDSNDATGKTKVVFFFRNISGRVALQKLGSTAIVRSNGTRSPKRRVLVTLSDTVDEHTVPFDARAEIPHTSQNS